MKNLTSGNWVYLLDMQGIDLLQSLNDANQFVLIEYRHNVKQEVHISIFEDSLRDKILGEIDWIIKNKKSDAVKSHYEFIMKQMILHEVGKYSE